jgi:hypothetical protein
MSRPETPGISVIGARRATFSSNHFFSQFFFNLAQDEPLDCRRYALPIPFFGAGKFGSVQF